MGCFLRQVNGWGYRRITTPGPDFNAYWHELFLRGLPDLCDRMKRPQKNDPELKNEDPPDFYRVSKFSPLPEPDHGRPRTEQEVGHSSSMSSASCPPRSRENGKASSRADATESGHTGISTLHSWDRHQTEKSKVAINLSDVYDHESSRNGALAADKLSEADLHYLIHQNRALLKQASVVQRSGLKYDEYHR